MCGANPHLGNKSWPQAIIKNIKKGDSSYYIVFFILALFFLRHKNFQNAKIAPTILENRHLVA